MADTHRLVFVGGLHRSGTTPFARMLDEHPNISGLTGTGVVENEGQHLQRIYPPANAYGGAGHFARDERAHLTEDSPLVTHDNAEAILDAWRPYWDLSCSFLVEKSPPNLIMSRFLQALFPDAYFIMIIRHPVTVALSTRKWTHMISRDPRKFAGLAALVDHWLVAHRLLEQDMPKLRRVLPVHYENLVTEPRNELRRVQQFLGLDGEIPSTSVSIGHLTYYQQRWDKFKTISRPGGWQRKLIERRYTDELIHFGYGVDDLSRHMDGALS